MVSPWMVSIRDSSAYPVYSAETKSPLFDFVVGSGRQPAPDPEQRLEGGHRSSPAVEAEDELVEVGLELEL